MEMDGNARDSHGVSPERSSDRQSASAFIKLRRTLRYQSRASCAEQQQPVHSGRRAWELSWSCNDKSRHLDTIASIARTPGCLAKCLTEALSCLLCLEVMGLDPRIRLGVSSAESTEDALVSREDGLIRELWSSGSASPQPLVHPRSK